MRQSAWLRGIFIGLAVAAAAAMLAPFWGRARLEASPAQQQGVTVAIDLERLRSVSLREGMPLEAAMDRLAGAGVTALVVEPRTLKSLADSGEVQVRWGWELLGELRARGRADAGGGGSPPAGETPRVLPEPYEPWHLLVRTADPDRGPWLEQALAAGWHGRVEGWFADGAGREWLAVSVPPENAYQAMQRRRPQRYRFSVGQEYPYELMQLPLGFFEPDLHLVQEAGFEVILRYQAAGAHEPAGTRGDSGEPVLPAQALGPAADLPGGTLLLVGEGSLGGGPEAAARWAAHVERMDWHVGWQAGPQAPDLADLARRVPHRLVKVHPVWPEESWDQLTGRVQGERARVMVFRWFTALDGPPGASGVLRLEELARWIEGGALPDTSAAADATVLAAASPAPAVPWLVLLLAAAGPPLAVSGALRVFPSGGGLSAAAGVLLAFTATGGVGLGIAALLAHPVYQLGVVRVPGLGMAAVAGCLLLAVAGWAGSGSGDGAWGRLANPFRAGRWHRPVTFGGAAGTGLVLLMAGLVVLKEMKLPAPPLGPHQPDPDPMLAVLGMGGPMLDLLVGGAALFAVLALGGSWAGERSRTPAALAALGQAGWLLALARVQIPIQITLVQGLLGGFLGMAAGAAVWAGIAYGLGTGATEGPVPAAGGTAMDSGGSL